MIRSRVPFWLLILLSAGCRTIPDMGPAPVARDLDSPLGFCVSWRSAEKDLPGIAGAGGGWVRLDFKWSKVEPQPGVWDFSLYDRLVEQAERENIRILGVLIDDVPWIHKEGKKRDYIPPSRIPDYCRFIEQVARRYGDRVSAWEIWNEPNTLHWSGPRSHFFRLFTAAVNTLEATLEDPYITTPGIFWDDTCFLKQLFRNAPMDKVDAISFHPYANSPEGSARRMIRMIKTARGLGYGGDFWISEAGFPAGGFYPSRMPEPEMGDAVIKTTGYALRLDVKTVIWYKYSDKLPRRIMNSEDWFGLTIRGETDPDGTGIRAFRFLTDHVSGSRIVPEGAVNREVPELFWLCLEKENLMLVLFWGKKGTPVTITAPEGALHGTSDTLEDPEPLPAGGTIKLAGLAEFLLIPSTGTTPVILFAPPDNNPLP